MKSETCHKPPVALFAFNRPDKMKRVLSALRRQKIDKLLVFVDGPRSEEDVPLINACRDVARSVNWTETEFYFSEQNHGLNGLMDNITLVMTSNPQAVFVEDDCLPMPGFYDFICRALDRYAGEKRVFSIAGYQPVPRKNFGSSPAEVVFSARFNCGGWSTWSDRWMALLPVIACYDDLFENLRKVPTVAGFDLPLTARYYIKKGPLQSWATKVAVACLNQNLLHLLPTRGLIRNIGYDLSGVHGGFNTILRGYFFQNRNIAKDLPQDILWPDEVKLDCDYAALFRDFMVRERKFSIRGWGKRLTRSVKRFMAGGKERVTDLDLSPSSHEPFSKRALVLLHPDPFLLPKDDPALYHRAEFRRAWNIVRSINDLGYLIDVISPDEHRFLPVRQYDLFFGYNEGNFSRISNLINPSALKISLILNDGLKKHTDSTSSADSPMAINDLAVRDDSYEWCSKDYAAGRKNFLFFLAPHHPKALLDLLIQSFVGLFGSLWVCSESWQRGLFGIRLPVLNGNIHFLDGIQPRSVQFYRLMRTCNFWLFPNSVSETQQFVECLNQGLIPVVSAQQAGTVEQTLDFIRWFNTESVENIRRDVIELSALPPETCQALSRRARVFALENHSEEIFVQNLQTALQNFL